MKRKISKKIKKLVDFGFGNVEIRNKLLEKGIDISNSTIYRHYLKKRKKFYQKYVCLIHKKIPENSIKTFARVYKRKQRGIFIEFALDPLQKLILRKEIRVLPYFSQDFTKMIIFPEKESKIKLYSHKNTKKICLNFSRFVENPDKFPNKISLYIPLSYFELEDFETITDKEARELYKKLKKFNWSLTELRCTDKNIYADLLVVSPNKKRYLMELTHEGKTMRFSQQIRKFLKQRLAGKLFFLKFMANKMNAYPLIILWSGLKNENVINNLFLDVCQSVKIPVLFTDFNKKWTDEIAMHLNKLDKNEI